MGELVSFKAVFPSRQAKFEASPPNDADVATVLTLALAVSRELAFENSPFNAEEIARIAPRSFDDLQGVSIGDIEKRLAPLAEKPVIDETKKAPSATPLDLAVSYYFGALVDKALGVAPITWSKPSDPQRIVRLVANYGGWQVVKKVSSDAPKKEIVAGCSGIFSSCKNKAADFLDEGYYALSQEFFSKYPERKSFARLQEMLRDAPATAHKIVQLNNGVELKKLFYYSLFERAGYPCFISTDQVGAVWPELKIPKPRGNYGGKKKK
ncbi:hypothetical protein AUJ14_04965 [Candidatus Micrarchaeota archaeon CG1_02_55_22]|nr:MAG: hypothetical protein AUJ14_04965 [Candidatus Micrarchaeota archaeon CG1_02_55_22]